MNNSGITISQEKEIWRLQLEQAGILLRSNAIPSKFRTSEQVIAAIQFGRELGYPPMTALKELSLINGAPTLSAKLVGSLLMKNGYHYKPTIYTDNQVEIEFTYPNGEKISIDFTLEDAKAAGLTSKDNYKKHTKEMLFARCLTRGGRIVAPHLLTGGFYNQYEIVEDDTQSVIDTVNSRSSKIEKLTKEQIRSQLADTNKFHVIQKIYNQLTAEQKEDKEIIKLFVHRKQEIQASINKANKKPTDNTSADNTEVFEEGEIVEDNRTTKQDTEVDKLASAIEDAGLVSSDTDNSDNS